MQIKIEIDESYIAELVSQEIASRIVAERGYEGREAKYGIRDGVDKAIKQYIYSKKDAVIDRVVERASVDRKSTRLNSSHSGESRMPSSA